MLDIPKDRTSSGKRRTISRISKKIKGYLKGERNERRALKLTRRLYQKGLIPHATEIMPRLTAKWSEQDMRGIDLIVPTDYGDIYLQVKSSRFGMKSSEERFYKKFLSDQDRLKNWIPHIVVNNKLTDAQITERIRRACWSRFYDLEDYPEKRTR